MSDVDLVTIGITTFNAAQTIRSCVVSATQQTWSAVEIILVDDCSQDETPAIAQKLASQIPHMRVILNPDNRGVAAARNQILAAARGAFVVFFDDDDASEPDRIKRQINRILAYEQAFAPGALVLCHTARRVQYPDGSELIHPTIGQQEGCVAPHGISLARRAVLGTPLKDSYGSCPTCSQLARLSTYQAVGGFDPDFRRAEDSDLLVRIAKAGGHIVGVADPLVIQAMTPTSDKSLADERYYTLKWLEKHRDLADAEGLYDFYRQWLSLKYAWLERKQGRFIIGLARIGVTYPGATLRRLTLAWRNFKINRSFRQFHAANPSNQS